MYKKIAIVSLVLGFVVGVVFQLGYAYGVNHAQKELLALFPKLMPM